MRPCVIFNPAAKGEKAKRFRQELDHIASRSVFKFTSAAGDARRLAAEAVSEGHETVVAAGGDGTVNEVLNGIGDVPNGFSSTRLGVIPLGTINVLARELQIPLKVRNGWDVIEAGQETQVDLPWLERNEGRNTLRHHFVQLGGAGLDARAVELVDWGLKRKVGPVAYVLAGLRAMREVPVRVTAQADHQVIEGNLVLIGNGRLYGGNFNVFPNANLRDGKLDLCAFPSVNWWVLLRCTLPLLLSGRLPGGVVQRLSASRIHLTSNPAAPVELDGELAGHLPVTIGVEPLGLRVLVPG